MVWQYTKIVKDHFFHPRNLVLDLSDVADFNAEGEVGSAVCGDQMKIFLKIKNNKIIDCKWQTFGCASAIASTSMLSEMIMKSVPLSIEEALKISAMDIVKKLGGLPPQKVHCSVLGDQALRKAICNWKKKLATPKVGTMKK